MQPEPSRPTAAQLALALLRAGWILGAVLLGGLVGWVIGEALGHPGLLALTGALVAALPVAVIDALRSTQVLNWLRGPGRDAAPELPGRWGEAAYRAERAFRLREQATEVQRRRLEEFLSAIEASPNGVLLLDADDEILWCSAVAADHFGLDPARDLRQRVTNLVRAPAFVTYLAVGDFSDPLIITGPAGQLVLSVQVRPYRDGQRLVLTQDVTEGQRTEAMRRDFVANVSHEIRTPLTVLAGFVETLASLPLSPGERQRVLTLMAQQTDRMQALVSDLLTLARLEGSPRPAPDRWHDVRSLLLRAQADGQALSAGQHTLSVHGGDDAEIAGSRTELLSAVGNLVNNAVRYTPAGGRIDIHFHWRTAAGAEIEVSDTGAGIAREHLPRITERFYRVDSSRSRETGGTGLGLSIVKHVVQRHGGDIDVDSEPGRGSRFRLIFPALRVRRRAPDALPSVPGPTTVASE